MTEPPLKPLKTPASRRSRRNLRTPNPEVRRRLLDAARELIQEEGFPALRVDQIAERAGLSVGTFYLYFEGKDDLFANLVVEHTQLLRDRQRQAMENAASDAERGDARLDAYLDFVEENAAGFLHFLRAGSLETTHGDLSSWAYEQHAVDLRPLMAESLRLLGCKPIDQELLVQSLLAVTRHIAGYWLEHRDSYSREQIRSFIQELTRAVLLGLRVP